MTLLQVSAMKRFPAASTATPVGSFSWALVAARRRRYSRCRVVVSGDRGDHARGMIDFADDVVAAVGDEEISRGIHRDARGVVEFGAGGRAAVAAVAPGPVSGDRGDHARGEIDLADDVVAAVGDEEVPRGVHRDAHGVVKFGGWWPLRRRRCSPRSRFRRPW